MSHSPPPDLAIDPRHVALQFERRQPWRDAAFLHQEIGNRMLERLAYIRLAPAALLDAGCGAGTAIAGLRARYPDAIYHGLDQSARALEAGRAAHGTKPGGWRRWLGRKAARPETRFLVGDLARTPLSDETVDLVWSNLVLHWHPRPHQVFAEWFRVLRPQGLAMFSTYGPATLREVRAAVAEAGLATATLPLVDMHDFGDLLLENGFADPVMDQETLTLTYSDAAELLADVRRLGGNPARGRHPGLAGRGFRQRLLDALEAQRGPDGHLRLTLEVAYGHAWRANTRRQGQETLIPVSAISRRRDPA